MELAVLEGKVTLNRSTSLPSAVVLSGRCDKCFRVIVPSLSPVRLFVTPWTVACQAPLSTGFSRQEYWSGLLCPPPGDLPHPGIKPPSLVFPALQADSLSELMRLYWKSGAEILNGGLGRSPCPPGNPCRYGEISGLSQGVVWQGRC